MKIVKTKFNKLLIIKGKKFSDKRGYFREILIEKLLKKRFPFKVISSSKKNVIRGMHYQSKNAQGKYISVIKGKIFDVALDLRKKSKTFGKYFSIVLSDKNCTSIYIPKGFAHGFAGLEKDNVIVYSCTNYRNKNAEKGILWKDKKINIKWPIKKPILSAKDRINERFNDKLIY